MKDFFESYCQLRIKISLSRAMAEKSFDSLDHAKIIIVSSSIDIFGGIVTLNLDWA
jgi:hypothetical protein